ncbi:hypothetical protein CCHR01_12505 [Colletotrichum chrysophilum]|uniref:Secreted protein n=1 Tax=Colletotrichum chrysophilum TaxID=1836956 RepID=A0AAD9ABU8_9PEZI|nr:hypothetical protein CCHR01_12505 [Colletotrichum chrysophilum]
MSETKRSYSIISRNRESLVGLLLLCLLGSLRVGGGEMGPSRSSLASTNRSDSSSLVIGLTSSWPMGDRGLSPTDLLPLLPAMATSRMLADLPSRLVALSLARRVSATPPIKPLSSGGFSPAAERPRGREKRDLSHSFILCVGDPLSLGERAVSLPLGTSFWVLMVGFVWLALLDLGRASASLVSYCWEVSPASRESSVGTSGCFDLRFSLLERRFSSALAAFSSSFLALESIFSRCRLSFSSCLSDSLILRLISLISRSRSFLFSSSLFLASASALAISCLSFSMAAFSLISSRTGCTLLAAISSMSAWSMNIPPPISSLPSFSLGTECLAWAAR